jgi:hypothetical protein
MKATRTSNKMQQCMLVGGFNPLKTMKVSWDDYSQYMENKGHAPNHHPDNYH